MRAKPSRDKEDPTRNMLRSDIDAPKRLKSKTASADPILEKLLTDNDAPN
jgi:hypothetical protein